MNCVSPVSFKNHTGTCTGTVKVVNGIVTVNGNCSNKADGVEYVAAAPPNLGSSYMGSALPFANPYMAYEGTPNRGSVPVINNKFEFQIRMPNSYYVHGGKILIEPHVHVRLGNVSVDIPLGASTPLRSLTSLTGMPNRATRR